MSDNHREENKLKDQYIVKKMPAKHDMEKDAKIVRAIAPEIGFGRLPCAVAEFGTVIRENRDGN